MAKKKSGLATLLLIGGAAIVGWKLLKGKKGARRGKRPEMTEEQKKARMAMMKAKSAGKIATTKPKTIEQQAMEKIQNMF